MADEAFDHLVSLAGGDARAALNVLEGAVALAEAEGVRDKKGRVAPRLEDVEAAAQQRILGYDRAGDGHYDTVSAFIKSLRGNDPDAALYWLATMIAAGEDPKFIARRLIISASEDVGNADPRALAVAVAAAQALDRVGLPEAQYALAQAADVHRHRPEVEPLRVGLLGGGVGRRRAWLAAGAAPPAAAPYARMKQHGIGVGYRYSHDFEGADVEQQYLPDELVERRYYLPTDQGYEATIGGRMAGRAEARATAKAAGRTQKDRFPTPQVKPRAGKNLMDTREANRKKLAETEKRDASG